MKFTPTNHRNPCPICQDTRGDCRTTEDNLILCHSFIEQDSGIAGWKWTKASSNGVWGVHVRDRGKDFNPEQYERYLAHKKAQQRNKKQFLADNALDADGRDKAIRKLDRNIGLSDRHRQDLKNRGLSDAKIEAGLFLSIDPWKQFDLDLPENLPGIHYKGDRFATKDTGYACVIFDKQGRALGWQLRVEGATGGNKYKWAKGTFSSHLPNGELPITIIKPNKNALKTLYLSEGILKPAVASYLHDIAICGAAGGHFKGSPEQLTEIVSDYEELAIAPDGGDVLNPQVMRRWEKQINYLKQFKKPIRIIWWGQVQKSDGDLDEIDSVTFSKAEHLTPKEFFKLAKKEQHIKQEWDNWKNYKKFTPQTKIEKKFVEFGLPQSDTITFIKSGLGTGKTTETIRHLLQLQKYGIIGLGYRNTLLLQFNEKAKSVGFYHLQSDKNLREFSLDNPELKVTNCVDSLVYYSSEQFDDKIIIIDEIISVLKHFLFSSTIKQFSKVKKLFTEMVNRCDRLICLDGFMTDWAVTFFKELCPTKQIVTIENTHQGDKAKVYLLEGTIDIDEKIKLNDKTPWLEKLLNSQCPVICSDSQVFCEAIERLLQEQGRNGVRVDSKTVSQKHVKDFFTEPDKYIRSNKPEYLIYSPSAESGLDVPTLDYFSEHFSFFFGQLDIDSMIQMLGRIRDINVPKYVWCKKFILPEDTKRRPSNVESIQADRARALMNELHSTLNSVDSNELKIARLQQIYQDNIDPYTTAADTITAIRNHEFANYRECLKRQLTDNGYPVEAVTLEALNSRKAIALQEKEAKTEVKRQNASDIYHASDRYIGQSQVNLSFDASWETRCAVTKAKLVNRLPGINKDTVWTP
ncbi:MAG TPA: plasmid replication protein, CyRepA1 family, partial [Coleofasciculaceae cyanobacterium]